LLKQCIASSTPFLTASNMSKVPTTPFSGNGCSWSLPSEISLTLVQYF
jgi:hypothetical protein